MAACAQTRTNLYLARFRLTNLESEDVLPHVYISLRSIPASMNNKFLGRQQLFNARPQIVDVAIWRRDAIFGYVNVAEGLFLSMPGQGPGF